MSTVREFVASALRVKETDLLEGIEDPVSLLVDASKLGVVELVEELVDWEETDSDALKRALSVAKDSHTVAVLLRNLLVLAVDNDELLDELDTPLLSLRDHFVVDEEEECCECECHREEQEEDEDQEEEQ